MIEFKGVTKEYPDGTVALEDVDLKIKAGEFVFIVGPSGVGKTTIVKLLIREELPSVGEILFEGVNVAALKRSELPKLRREVGVVFQDNKLLSSRTVFENVALALEVAGRERKEIGTLVPSVLQIVNLKEKAGHFPRQLSGGEKQRVAIARAIVHEPKVLVADEPTGDIDPALSWSVMELLGKVNRWGTTVVVATHDADLVNSLKKRVVALKQGRVVRDEKEGKYEI